MNVACGCRRRGVGGAAYFQGDRPAADGDVLPGLYDRRFGQAGVQFVKFFERKVIFDGDADEGVALGEFGRLCGRLP